MNRVLPLLFLLVAAALSGQDIVPEAPSAVLLDQLTGRVLFQKNPNRPIPPASLTKLMTLHLAWKALADHQTEASQVVPITEATTGSNVPPGSSLMFLEPGQKVTFRELMLGLAVDSGNDAGLTLAQFLAGSQEAFVAQMNAEARALGLSETTFYDSFGYDARNVTTAGDFAQFSRYYLAAHPQAVELLHSVREMAFPLSENRAEGDRRRARTIVQENRNTLLGLYPGADGLKTGFIEESGYNLAATAKRGPQRLVAVLLGVQGRNTAEGGNLRTAAAMRLLDYGFATYPLRPLPTPPVKPVRLWYSEPGAVVPVLDGDAQYPLDAAETQGLVARLDGPGEFLGPVAAGTVLGHMVWTKDGQEIYRLPLKASRAVEAAPWWTSLWDAVVLFFRGFSGTPAPESVSGAGRT